MKRLIVLGLLLAGCAQRHELSTEPIALTYAQTEASKTDALTVGDEVTVYASVDGTQNYFLNAHKFVAGSDGRTLTAQPAVFYPDAKQAATFYAYFGSQSVPSDQSTPADLKKADLCWAAASSTPTTAAVPLAFSHVFARLVVTCSAPTSKILIPSAFSGGTLDVRSGVFTNSTKSDVWTAGNELIAPAQTLSRLIISSGSIDYVFDGSIALESGKTTTVNLTLNTATKTASLGGSSVAVWASQTASGTPAESVSNVLSLHWPNYLPQGAAPDKVVFTVNGADYTVSSGITYSDKTFTVPFASSTLRYPYTVTKITFYNGSTQALPSCTKLLGATVYKSGTQTLGLKDPTPNVVRIGNLWWATGHLVADGPNDCRIGASTDCGLYFQFGSLIGWSGGAAPDYSGTGAWSSSAATVKVKPDVLHPSFDPGAVWPTGGGTTGLTKPYFSVTSAPYATYNTDIGAYAGAPLSGVGIDPTKTNLRQGRYYPMGIGDPCTYYLGAAWRLPNMKDFEALTGVVFSPNMVWVYMSTTGRTFSNLNNCVNITLNGATLSISVSNTRHYANGNVYDADPTWDHTSLSTLRCGGAPGYLSLAHFRTRNPHYMQTWLSVNHDATWGFLTHVGSGISARCVADN